MFKCRVCGEFKPHSDFYAAKGMASGHQSQCKACAKVKSKENRDRNVDYYQAFDRERGSHPHRKAAVRARAHLYARRYPAPTVTSSEKRSANVALNNAVQSGSVVKPNACERCGSDGKIHGHHHNYSKPLEVEWLCQPCHGAEHRAANQARREQQYAAWVVGMAWIGAHLIRSGMEVRA